MTNKALLADIWKFPWPLMDVLIGGNSSIDLPELRVASWEEATDFLVSYGYDPVSDDARRQMHAVIVESIAFIERLLLTPREWARGTRPPDDILLCDDPRQLLIWASSLSPQERLKRAWACAVLRVMHTIAHIEGVNRYISLQVARQQIMARFQRYIYRDADKQLWFGEDPYRVRLDRVEWKERKSRESIILKLLHKRDNVAETIYDYLGIRIVTTRLCDVLMVVKYMRQFHVIAYPNCYPSRSRNTLIDAKRFRQQIETLRDMLTAGSISPDEFETMVARLTMPAGEPAVGSTNPHSASSYRSIQLTCRQMIEAPNEQFGWLDKLERAVADAALPRDAADGAPPPSLNMLREMRALVDGWHAVKGQRRISSFFPFEVQILDAEAYVQANSGEANHDRYKLSQIRAARKRVLAKVLELSR